jgi:hypothetical protein
MPFRRIIQSARGVWFYCFGAVIRGLLFDYVNLARQLEATRRHCRMAEPVARAGRAAAVGNLIEAQD